MSAETGKNKKETELAAWNLSSHLIGQIGGLLQEASRNLRNGNIRTAFFATQEIRTLIYTDITNEEDEKLDELERKLNKYVSTFDKLSRSAESSGLDEDSSEKMRVLKSHSLFYITKYRRFIMGLLGKYGYLMAKKEDSAKMF